MNLKAIQEIATNLPCRTTAPIGFAFRDLQTGECISCNGDRPFPTASMYKLYILAELFRQTAEGKYRLSDRIPLTAERKSIGSGVLKNLDAGLPLTLKDYATLMMIISDNSATNVLFHLVGRENIRRNVLEPLNLIHTKCDFDCSVLIDRYYCLNGGSVADLRAKNGGILPSFRNHDYYACTTADNNQTAPMEAAKMLELLYRGEWVGPDASSQILEIMKLCQTNRRIPRHLPATVPVAHKTGTLDRECIDAGIVYTPKGDYILCLFYNGNLASEDEYARNAGGVIGEDLLAQISKEVYDAYME